MCSNYKTELQISVSYHEYRSSPNADTCKIKIVTPVTPLTFFNMQHVSRYQMKRNDWLRLVPEDSLVGGSHPVWDTCVSNLRLIFGYRRGNLVQSAKGGHKRTFQCIYV